MYADSIKRDEIRHDMIRAGIKTDTDLALRSGLSRGTVSNFFNGMTPTYYTMKAIAKALAMSEQRAGYIFFDQELT